MFNDELQRDSAKALSYKYQRLRERLRNAIAQGELTGKLPGERALGKRFQANAKTINKALSDLALEGLLTRHVGRGTFVKNSTIAEAPTAMKMRTYGWFMSASNGTTGQPLYDRAAQKVQQNGHRLEALLDLGQQNDTTRRNGAFDRIRGLAGLVLFAGQPSAHIVAELHRRHVPLVLANNTHPTMRTSAVLPDYAHGAFELTQHLIQLGHHLIVLIVDAELMPAAHSAELGYTSAMRRYGLSPCSKHAYSAGAIDPCDPQWQKNGSSAFVCIGSAAAAWMATELANAGLRVPQQVSLVAHLEPGTSLPVHQACTAYEVDVDCMVDWAAELLLASSPGQLPRMAIIPGRVADRGSAGPPPGGSKAPLAAPIASPI